MNDERVRIFPIGENALTIEFANKISNDLNDRVLSLDQYFEQHQFPGFVETVPAYSSLTIFFDLIKVRAAFSGFATGSDAVKELAEKGLRKAVPVPLAESQPREIPVYFDEASAPDLKDLAALHGLTREQVIEIFTSKIYRVYMLGFLPGFAYMGEVDERIATPRRDTPRVAVPKGSVGIAGRQTGIYPFESPGGWQIIGRTASELFTPDDETPCFFKPGERIKFYEVEKV
jgi:inhibitor of KinA